MRTALIGLGRIGWGYHLPQILSHEGFELCAVVDPSQERLDEAKALHAVEGFTDYKQMLAEAKPELVVIASPTPFHEEQAIAAMRAGANVLQDKPMTLDLASARRVAQVQKETGKKFVVYQPHRFSATAVAAKELIASGKLGTIYQLRASNCSFTRRNDWQSIRKLGGGMIGNYGAHYIDQLVFLSNSKVTNLQCQIRRILSIGDAEDVVHVLMETENGMLLDADINQATALPQSPLTIFGTSGTAQIRTNAEGKLCFYIKYCDMSKLPEKEASSSFAAANRQYPSDAIEWITEELVLPHWEDVPSFYSLCQEYFLNDGPTPVPLEQTLHVMELLEQCRANIRD